MQDSNNQQESVAPAELTRRGFLVQSARVGAATGLVLWSGRVWARESVVEVPFNTGIWSETGATEVLGKPGVFRNGEDKLEVFVRSERPQNALFTTSQNDANGTTYGQWSPYKDAKILRNPSVATASNGDVYVALVGADQKGRMAVMRKGGSWKTAFTRLTPFHSVQIAGQPTMMTLGDDELGYVMRATSNWIYFRRLSNPALDAWSAWVYAPFYGLSDVAGHVQEDGTTALFARDNKNKLQAAIIGTNKTMTWKSGISSEFEGTPAVGRNSDGRLTVFLIGRNGNDEQVLFMRTQTKRNAPFVGDTDWTEAKGVHVRGTPAIGTYRNKKLAVFSRADDKKIYLKVQKEADGDYEDWAVLDSGDVNFNEDPVVATNENGTLEVFARGNDGKLYHTHQKTENGDFEKPN